MDFSRLFRHKAVKISDEISAHTPAQERRGGGILDRKRSGIDRLGEESESGTRRCGPGEFEI